MQMTINLSVLGRIMQCVTVAGALMCLTGCPDVDYWGASSSVQPANKSSEISLSQVAATEPTTTAADRPSNQPRALSFEVCGEQSDWQRPDAQTYYATLQAHPRYADGLTEEPLKSLYEKFWQESVFSFTTYGLSARMEPILLSGIGDTIDQMEGCYKGDRPNAINDGDLAEIWLLGYQVTDILWTGEAYQITVVGGDRGLQFVQFERQENRSMLPIVVVQRDGQPVVAVSGDG